MTLITVEVDGPVAVLTLNRPDRLNALGLAGDGDLAEAACDRLNADHGIRCAILTGAGRAFSAGGDLNAMEDPDGPFMAPAMKVRDHYRSDVHRIARAFHGLEIPLIAAVNGPAAGLGCDISCMADIRIASDRARFGVTFLKIGLVPGDGGSWLLPRIIGMSRAAELLYSGDMIDAQTAAAWGMVSRVVPHDALMDEARALAARIAAMPSHALRLTKTLLREGQTSTYPQALEMAAMAQAMAHAHPAHSEGVRAVLEKRPPLFPEQ
ncbi:MAG: enoyl-CoA hydratase [Sphingobium sp.]|jgi:enoyl-CoA hydratase/carnithine racemase|nr:MAG: enoyl-CoA hydratase [Sphingobium sp.]